MFEVVSLLIFATVVTNQLYHASSQETTSLPMAGNSKPSHSKVTLEKVTAMYRHLMPECFDGFDKEIEHKRNFGLITVSSKLSLRNCHLCDLYRMYLAETNVQHKVRDLDITQGTVYLPNLNIWCFLNIQQMGSSWESVIGAAANKISSNLTIVQADDLSVVSIIYKPLNEPKLPFTSIHLETSTSISVSKYFLQDLTLYLTQVMNEYLKTKVPLYLKQVAKKFIVETPLNSSGEEILYLEQTTIAPFETIANAIAVNPRCLNFTIEDVISKYYSTAPDISGFDKTFVHTQNFVLINVTSELILNNCRLFGLRTLKLDGVYHENQELDFEITETTVNIPRLTINCNLKIRQLSSSVSTDFEAYSGTIPGDLTIIQNRDLDLVSIKFKVLQEPRIRLTINNPEVLSFVKGYFMHDLTEYLTKVMSDNVKTTVPSYLRKVVKSL